MTSDHSEDGPLDGRPQAGRGPRRLDQGDLWGLSDDEVAAPPPARRAARRPDRRRQSETAGAGAGGGRERQRAPEAPTRASQPPLVREEPPAYPRPAVPAYDEDDDDYYEDEPSLLGNPYFLAAVAVAGAILLAVAVVFLFGRDDDNGGGTGGTTANATRTPAATAGSGTGASGLLARSIAISTVREGPALSQLELGTLPADQDVDVVGRNEDATWFQIVFPAGTALRGWVPESALRLPDNVAAVVGVVEATPVPRPEVPEPTATEPPAVEETATPTGEQEGPDLAVSIASDCAPGSEIVIAISNAGTEELVGELIEVIVSNNSIVQYQQPFQADMAVGAGAQLNTGVEARAPEMSVVVLLKELDDVDPTNNGDSCAVQAAAPNNGGGNVPPAIGTQAGQQ